VPIPAEEFPARRRRALEEAEARGLDALLVWSRCGAPDCFADVHYFANHYSPYPWVPPSAPVLTGTEHAGLIVTRDGATLLVSGFASAEAQVDEVRRSWDLRTELLEAIGDLGLGESRLGLIGAEVLPFSFARALAERFPGLELVAADDVSARLRMRLSDAEVGLLREAGAAGRRIVDAAIGAAVPGATDGDFVGAGLAESARIPGCLHWTFLAGSGPDVREFASGSMPPWNPSYAYRPGDVVHADCYGFVVGYPYDLARTVVVGEEPSAAQARVMDGARGLVEALAARLAPGVTARDLHREGLAFLRDAGLSAGDLPGFGHGIGSGFIPPYIAPAERGDAAESELPLEPPIGLAFEVFLSDGDGHYAAYEDDFVWLEDGVVCTTR
jgi:Xaa-Pro aminopeptidase